MAFQVLSSDLSMCQTCLLVRGKGMFINFHNITIKISLKSTYHLINITLGNKPNCYFFQPMIMPGKIVGRDITHQIKERPIAFIGYQLGKTLS